MSAELHSFGWLHRHHPDAHAALLTEHSGDRGAAAENWVELQEQIHERGIETAVKAERVRCLDLQLDAQERGLPIGNLIAAIDSGKPGVQLPEFEPLHVSAASGSSLADSIVARALGSGA